MIFIYIHNFTKSINAYKTWSINHMSSSLLKTLINIYEALQVKDQLLFYHLAQAMTERSQVKGLESQV